MRVLHLVPQLFGRSGIFGGAERYATELATAMSAQAETRLVGFRPRRNPGAAPPRRQGALEVYRLRNYLLGPRFDVSPAGPTLLPHFLWADVIHCHQIYTLGTSAALLYARATRKPVFLTDHGGGGVSLNTYWKLEGAATARLWVSGLSQRASSVPPRPGDQIIYGGFDPRRFVPAASAAPPATDVLYVGRVVHEKNLHHLVAAVDQVTRVSILGPAYDPAYLRELLELGRGKSISYLPEADGDALVQAYQQALCVVLPGRETLGLTALEAMACGRPAVCMTNSGIAEIIEDGRTGWIVPAGDAAALRDRLAWVRTHPAEAAAAGRAACARIQTDFTWEAVARRCLAAYANARAAAAPPAFCR